ncbi:MAG: transposase [Patescibacteria group bacterium]
MPIKRPLLANGEIYHIVVRAVDDLKLFRDEKDYLRKIHNLFEFNDSNPTKWQYRQYYENGSREINKRTKRNLLAEILTFCLMPNHIHLLVRQLIDGGISKFMRKIGAGYGIYYNNKYKRSGHIFQGKYRAVQVKSDQQLQTVFVYIHANPVSLVEPGWKEKGIKNINEAINFLENYRWSSYLDYLQNKNFPSLTNREFLTETFGGSESCREIVNDWLKYKKELFDFDKVAIE